MTLKAFMSKVSKTSSCWLWSGYTMPKGHGFVGVKRKYWLAHRLSWVLHGNQLPPGMCVLHKCDVANCVNPKHLYLGTRQDNVADRCRRNRTAKGERNSHAKLTPADIAEIRRIYSHIPPKFTETAKRFGVSGQTISWIVKHRLWKHLP